MKNDLSFHNLSVEDATKLALGHSGGYSQKVEHDEMVQAKQWQWRGARPLWSLII